MNSLHFSLLHDQMTFIRYQERDLRRSLTKKRKRKERKKTRGKKGRGEKKIMKITQVLSKCLFLNTEMSGKIMEKKTMQYELGDSKKHLTN